MAPVGIGIGVGKRLSFSSALCTVRYIGLVEGAEGEWLGVEWDDDSKGKHDGSRDGKRYFQCWSRSATAASFIRPSRTADPERTFIEAVHHKYATDQASASPSSTSVSPPGREIVISGKLAEEVGFEKIRKQQSQLHELKIVIVDGLQINGAGNAGNNIKNTCSSLMELDLSRNLLESFLEVVRICSELPLLKKLRLNGNRFVDLLSESSVAPSDSYQDSFINVTELELDETCLPWKMLMAIRCQFPNLQALEASSNGLRRLDHLQTSPFGPHLTDSWRSSLKSLTLEYNAFESIADLAPLVSIETLKILRLKGNNISSLVTKFGDAPITFSGSLHYLDISYNLVDSWGFLDGLIEVFPGLTALRFSNNPIYAPSAKGNDSGGSEEGYMITTARLGQLQTLNFSKITAADRTNAEMYYLSKIAQELAEVSEGMEGKTELAVRHPRYGELCRLYGTPVVSRKQIGDADPAHLEARIIHFTCYLAREVSDIKEHSIEIPKSCDVYRTKGLIGKLFKIQPWGFCLIWETGEWDPVAGYEDDELDLDDDDALSDIKPIVCHRSTMEHNGKWIQREVEIQDSTRQIGNCVDGLQVKVRIELRNKQ